MQLTNALHIPAFRALLLVALTATSASASAQSWHDGDWGTAVLPSREQEEGTGSTKIVYGTCQLPVPDGERPLYAEFGEHGAFPRGKREHMWGKLSDEAWEYLTTKFPGDPQLGYRPFISYELYCSQGEDDWINTVALETDWYEISLTADPPPSYGCPRSHPFMLVADCVMTAFF